MKMLGSRRSRLIATGIGVVVLLGGVVVMMQNRGGEPSDALAAADSSGVAIDDSTDNQAKDKDKKKEQPPVPVELVAAAPRDIPAYFNSTGSLEAKRQVDLISKAGGQIVRLSVEEGDFVKQGQVLLELDHREEKLLVDQTRVKAETAKNELARIKGLVNEGLGSEKNYEAASELAEVAELEHNLSKVRLDNKIIRAPFSGQITVRHVELGQTVNVGTELVEIADVSPLEVRLFLPEKIVNRLSTGQPVEIRSDLAEDRPLVGTVERIAPSVDTATSTVKVTLQVNNSDGSVRVGSFVRARITTDVVRNAVSVPKRALVPEAGVTYVFVADGDSVHKVTVTTGYADDDYIEITEGIETGTRVVTVGQGGLRQGSKIKDLNAAPDEEGQGQVSAKGAEQEYADAEGN